MNPNPSLRSKKRHGHKATHFVIINQHGDNRGDEAALRGMYSALTARVPYSTFTVLHQFSDPASAIQLPGVKYLPLRIPIHEAICLSMWAVLRRLGIRTDAMLGQTGRKIVAAYEQADVFISAPGGPYFGDLYAGHEIVHWFYTWMATLHKSALFLYQPSVGPFHNRALNYLRRRGFQWFEELIVREAISANNLEELIGRRPRVGSDSALQQVVDANRTSEKICEEQCPQPRPLVTGTFRDPGIRYRAAHDAAVVELLVRCSVEGRSVVLLPQLHGPRHRDAPYLASLAERAREHDACVTVASEDLSSTEQRALVAASDFVLAGRYHPLVFAVSAGVPALVIPYEHKAQGFADAAGLTAYVVELQDLGPGVLVARLEHLLKNFDEVRDRVRHAEPVLREAALATSDLVANFLVDYNSGV